MPFAPPFDLARPQRFVRGQFLIEAGTPTEAVYLLRRGHVRIFVLDQDGRESVTALLGPGHMVGIGALLGRATHHAFAEALSTVDTYAMPSATLQTRMVTDRALLGLVLGGVAQRLALEQALLRDAVLLPGSERLRDIAARLPRDGTVLSGAAMAAILGLRPETLSRLSHNPPAADQSLTASRRSALPVRLPGQPGQRTLPLGTALPMQDDCIMLIRSGRVRLFVGGNGRELYIATLGAGDLLNLANTLGTRPLDLRAITETRAVIQEMGCSEFLRFLESDPATVRMITRRLIDRVVALDERSARAKSASTPELLAMRLHELSASEDDAPGQWAEVTSRWTHAALAREIGRTRESVTRALGGLEDAGYLRRQGRRLFVHRSRVAQDFNVLENSLDNEPRTGVFQAPGHKAANRS